MSARIVLVGPRETKNGVVQDVCPLLQVSPMDAGALISSGKAQVSLSLWGGPLLDATVLMCTDSWFAVNDASMYSAWEDLVSFLQQVGHPRFEVEKISTPIPIVAVDDEPLLRVRDVLREIAVPVVVAEDFSVAEALAQVTTHHSKIADEALGLIT